jgi:hypothetical protein
VFGPAVHELKFCKLGFEFSGGQHGGSKEVVWIDWPSPYTKKEKDDDPN